MPSRKQRRRRAKERRHAYEYVYVDSEGHELESPPEEPKPGRRNGKAKDAKKGGRRSRGPLREQNPPSWSKSARRALLFFPLFFIVFSLVNRHSALLPRVFASFAYSLLFIPLTYLMDRTAYRSFLRRSGRDAGARSAKR
jgi:hypothetical protein